MRSVVRVGGREVEAAVAREWVRAYLNGGRGQFGYPSYDGHRTNADPDRLCDGDLLAPVLLNVQIKISSFADLCACRNELETALRVVPVGVELADADEAVLSSVGELFAVLDSESRPRNVLGTTLAKVVHRKRPGLVPLYDEQVRRTYQVGEQAPLPAVPGRTWVEFMSLLAGTIKDDLNRELEFWDELATLRPADGPQVSRLRALDIVAWRLGVETPPHGPAE
jgi:hypothetical protein